MRNRHSHWCWCVLAALLMGAPLTAAPLDQAAIRRAERAIESAIVDGEAPGAVLLIGDRNGVTYLKAFGDRAVVPQREPMTVDTIFDMASLTKPIAAAAAVMKLVEQGRVSVSDPVSKYIPQFGAAGKDQITIEQLLVHRGGLIPDNSIRDYAEGPRVAMQRIYELSPRWPPGSLFKYTDVGYIVLGELVERVSGVPLDEFARKEIYEPLGMGRTTFRPPAEWRDRIAPTEPRDGVMLRGEVHDPRAAALGGVAGHAGLFSTAEDVSRFCRMLLRGGELDGKRVFKPETVNMMTATRMHSDSAEDAVSQRTYGFDVDTSYSSARGERFARGSTFGHTGFTGTMIWVDPIHDVFVILLTSRLHPDGKGNVVRLRHVVATAAAEAALGLDPALDVARIDAKGDQPVLVGVDAMQADDWRALRGRRVGLITNHTGVDSRGRRTIDLMHESKNVNLVTLFSPEHGIEGKLDEKIGHSVEPRTGLRIWSLYGEIRKPTAEMLEGVDTLVFDIQDIGTRFYTYISTMGLAMAAAAENGVQFWVLDRPNPIAPLGADGPIADADKLSFIAHRPIPLVHGMTAGELARLFQHEYGLNCGLRVVPAGVAGKWWDETGLTWVNPSPNMRNPTQALIYPAIGLIEATNISVGRGTDQPFEVFGAPWIEADQQGHRRLADALNAAHLPGLRFTPIIFTPDATKFAHERCGGIYVTVTDRAAVQPARTGLTIAWTLRRLFGEKFEIDRMQRMLVNDEVFDALKSTDDPARLPALWRDELQQFVRTSSRYWIYERTGRDE